jgi:hypothetical protein
MQKPFRAFELQFAPIYASTVSDLLDSAGYAADRGCIDRSRDARTRSLLMRAAVNCGP